MRLPRRSTPASSARPTREMLSCARGAATSPALLALALVAFLVPALPDTAEAQRRGTRGAASARSVGTTSPRSTARALRATRGRSLTVRGVPTTPHGIRRLPVIGRDRRVLPGGPFLRPFTPREAPIVEVIPGDPFGRDGFGRDRRDPFGDDRFGHDRRDRFGDDRFGHDRRDPFGRDRRDRFRRDGFDRGGHFRDGAGTCGSATGLRVRVGSHGVSVGVGSGGRRPGRGAFRCVKDRRGGVILVPIGAVYYGGTGTGDGYAGAADPADPRTYGAADGGAELGAAPADDGPFYAENASGAAFSGSDRGVPLATGCAAVTVRLRGGEWYGGLVRLPALDAETPEALAAALRIRHRHGRSTMLKGFEGLSVAVPAGPGVEGVDVEPCS